MANLTTRPIFVLIKRKARTPQTADLVNGRISSIDEARREEETIKSIINDCGRRRYCNFTVLIAWSVMHNSRCSVSVCSLIRTRSYPAGAFGHPVSADVSFDSLRFIFVWQFLSFFFESHNERLGGVPRTQFTSRYKKKSEENVGADRKWTSDAHRFPLEMFVRWVSAPFSGSRPFPLFWRPVSTQFPAVGWAPKQLETCANHRPSIGVRILNPWIFFGFFEFFFFGCNEDFII